MIRRSLMTLIASGISSLCLLAAPYDASAALRQRRNWPRFALSAARHYRMAEFESLITVALVFATAAQWAPSHMKTLALVTLLLTGPTLAYAAPAWNKLGTRQAAGYKEVTESIFVDTNSIVRSGDEVNITFLFDGDIKGGRNYVSTVEAYQFNCASRTRKTLGTADFEGHMGSGKLLSDYITSPNPIFLERPPTPVKANSFGERLLKVSCEQNSPPSQAKFGASSSGPSESGVREYLSRKISAKGKSLVRLSQFKKTDGLSSNLAGVSQYAMDWIVNLDVAQDCWFNASTFEAAIVEPGSEILYVSSHFRQYKKGQVIALTGQTSFIKKESGWQVR